VPLTLPSSGSFFLFTSSSCRLDLASDMPR
jgi:hypothetical protein